MNGHRGGGPTARAGKLGRTAFKAREDSVTRAREALVAQGAESGLRCRT